VLREPTRTKWWGTAGAPLIPRSVDSRPPWQVACRHTHRNTGRDRARERAQAGSVPRIARGLEGKKIGLIIAVARAPRLRAMTFPSPIVPSWHKKKKKRQVRSWGGASRSNPRSAALGSFVNSETGHSEDQQPNLRHALGSVKRVKVRAVLGGSYSLVRVHIHICQRQETPVPWRHSEEGADKHTKTKHRCSRVWEFPGKWPPKGGSLSMPARMN
jgi:hypothetical protein